MVLNRSTFKKNCQKFNIICIVWWQAWSTGIQNEGDMLSQIITHFHWSITMKRRKERYKLLLHKDALQLGTFGLKQGKPELLAPMIHTKAEQISICLVYTNTPEKQQGIKCDHVEINGC